jgi:hypothetical protein
MTPGVPLLDPLPLPAPAWLLSALLALTFTLHVVPMNLLLGGSLIAVVARFRGRRDNYAAALAGLIARAMPVVFASAVTMGVAALLFLQALYGRVFFPGAVLLAVPWILIVPLIVVAYSGAYWQAGRGSGALLVALPVLAVAFIQANVMGLLLRPETFAAMFFADASGLRLNLGDPTLAPRFLHVLVGALAVSGLAISVAGFLLRQREPELGPWMVRHGVFWAAGATVVNILPGFWWLAALPSGMLLQFMGRDLAATLWLTGGVLAALAALGHMIPAAMAREPRQLLIGGVGSLLVSIVCMVVVRDIVRRALLGPGTLPPAEWVAPQWGAIAIFGALLVAAIATVVWMVGALAGAERWGRIADRRAGQ